MNNHVIRLGLVILFATLTSLTTMAQSKYKGPVYELKITGIEEPADIKNLVTYVRNSPDVEYCRVGHEQGDLVIQTKEAMSYEELKALINETGFSLVDDVVTSKGVRMHSNGEVTQPVQTEHP
jgi:hypothetical protein